MTSFYESVQDAPPKEGLRQAFELFNEMSQQLTESYTNLENQVQALSGELAEVSAARMRELKEKERLADRLDSLLQLLPGGVVVLDGQGYVQECNRAALSMLDTSDLKHQLWRNVIKTYFRPKEDDGHEVSVRNGKRLSIQTSGLENEPGQIVLMTDQTETRELQSKLARHQRLTEMGKMVASLAHQVRTPLSGAMLYAEHLSNESIDASMRFDFSKKLMRQLKSIEAQVRDMMIFARGSAPLNQRLDSDGLEILLKESIQLLTKQYPNAHIEMCCDDYKGAIQCHSESLLGAIQNLISNGIEAAENQAIEAHIYVYLASDDNGIELLVEDNGPGISEEAKNKMLEPFFTTKSNGTGLGIPVVNAVVRAHHGQMQFYNRESHGACFQINIPFSESSEV